MPAATDTRAASQAVDPWARASLLGQCDSCSARALVLTELAPDGEDRSRRRLGLQWCKHHFDRHEAALAAAGALVVADRRAELYA